MFEETMHQNWTFLYIFHAGCKFGKEDFNTENV